MELLQPELSASLNVQQRFRAQASGLQCTSYRSACVAVNCMRCGRLTMVAGSATLVQGCERSFSGQGPGLSSKCSAEILDGRCCWFVVFLFLLVCFCGVFCVFGLLAGTACRTAYRSSISAFVAID